MKAKVARFSTNHVRYHAAGHWFDKDSMRFFRSRIDGTLWEIGGRLFFISSEKFESSRFSEARKYSIREAVPVQERSITKYRIETVGAFQKFATKRQADKFLQTRLPLIVQRVTK